MLIRSNGMSAGSRVASKAGSLYSTAACSTPLGLFHAPTRHSWKHPTRPKLVPDTLRFASTQAFDEVRDVAIFGGGITALASAFFLSENLPDSKITIYEGSDRLGGWIDSHMIEHEDGKILFEGGPRSLRPAGCNGQLMLSLIQKLGLNDSLLLVPKSSPAAHNRFIYYPDHLVRMPGPGASAFFNLWTLWTEPAFAGTFPTFREPWVPVRDSALKDESVGSFMARRLGNEAVVNNIISAVLHGIYGGNVWSLSMRSIMPLLWEQERRQGGAMLALYDSQIQRQNWVPCADYEITNRLRLEDGHLRKQRQDVSKFASVLLFKKGLGELVEALQRSLSRDNIKIKLGARITKVERNSSRDRQDDILVHHTTHSAPKMTAHTHAISTIPTPNLSPLLSTSDSTYSTPLTPAVTVAVVNLYYRNNSLLQDLAPPRTPTRYTKNGLHGFGYLIPASIPFEQNPERALGVIFDSDITPDPHNPPDGWAKGTRLTVMLGGHWWDGWSAYPDEEECVDMAQAVLRRHLGIEEAPEVARCKVQRDCIPQYTVGFGERMQGLHRQLRDDFDGRLRVAGCWVGGVGVADCIRGGYEAARGLADGNNLTGLEGVVDDRKMALLKRLPGGGTVVTKVDAGSGMKVGLSEGKVEKEEERR